MCVTHDDTIVRFFKSDNKVSLKLTVLNNDKEHYSHACQWVVFLFGPQILTNNWGFRTNILDISLDRNFHYIHDIGMGIRSVSPGTLKQDFWM